MATTSIVSKKTEYPTYNTTVPHTVFISNQIVKGTTTTQVPARWSITVETTDSQGNKTYKEIFVSRDLWFSYTVGQPYVPNEYDYN